MYETVLIVVGIVLALSLAFTLALLCSLATYLNELDFDFTAGFSSLDDKPRKPSSQRLDIEV